MVEILAKDRSGQGCAVSWVYLFRQTSGLVLSAFVFPFYPKLHISTSYVIEQSPVQRRNHKLMVMTLLNMKFQHTKTYGIQMYQVLRGQSYNFLCITKDSGPVHEPCSFLKISSKKSKKPNTNKKKPGGYEGERKYSHE